MTGCRLTMRSKLEFANGSTSSPTAITDAPSRRQTHRLNLRLFSGSDRSSLAGESDRADGHNAECGTAETPTRAEVVGHDTKDRPTARLCPK